MADKKDNLACIEDLLRVYPELKTELDFGMENSEAILRTLLAYVEDHKWLINEKIPFTVTLEQALFSWYENVYLSQKDAMRETRITWGFPTKPAHEIFDLVSKTYFLQRKARGTTKFTYVDACNIVLGLFSERVIPRIWGKLCSRGKL